jgi:hypothetical protein
MNVDGDSAAIILNTHNIVLFQDDKDTIAMPGHSLVNTVVYDLVYEMMKTVRSS